MRWLHGCGFSLSLLLSLTSQNAAFMRADPSSHVVMLYNMRTARDPQPYPHYFPYHFPVQVSCSNQTFWNVDAPEFRNRHGAMTVNVTHFEEVMFAIGVVDAQHKA
jgi:hypothetical protein